MPILHNAKKALRSSKKKAANNSRTKSRMKTAVDAVGKKSSKESVAEAYRRIDRAAKRGVIHKNAAARLKSQIGKKKAK
jgi:small subunit ribosomal protein S20